jgi:hypothetical protein
MEVFLILSRIEHQVSSISSIVKHRFFKFFFDLSSGLSWLGNYLANRGTKLFEQQSENKEKNNHMPGRFRLWKGAPAFLYCKDSPKCYGALIGKGLFKKCRENVK